MRRPFSHKFHNADQLSTIRPVSFHERFKASSFDLYSSTTCNFAPAKLRTRAANSLFFETVFDRNIETAFIRDAYMSNDRLFSFTSSWIILSSTEKLAHILLNPIVAVNILFRKELYVAAVIQTETDSINICCIYIPPSAD